MPIRFPTIAKTITRALSKSDAPVLSTELRQAEKLAQQEAIADALQKMQLDADKASVRERSRKATAARDLSGFRSWEEGGPTTSEMSARRKGEFEFGKQEGAKDINIGLYSKIEKLDISEAEKAKLYDKYKNDLDDSRFMSDVMGVESSSKKIQDAPQKPKSEPKPMDPSSSGSRELSKWQIKKAQEEAEGDIYDPRGDRGSRNYSEANILRNQFKIQDADDFFTYGGSPFLGDRGGSGSFSPLKKTAAAAALAAGASALSPDEAEAGYPGSAAAYRSIGEKLGNTVGDWVRKMKSDARDQLAKQFELDPTGAAQKEALRRLSARTQVRKNPITGEHEFKLYRGDTKDRFSWAPQSFTSDPKIASQFAEDYGGTVREVWVPASSIASIPSLTQQIQNKSSYDLSKQIGLKPTKAKLSAFMPANFDLVREKEVITSPFQAESTPYNPNKLPTLHERISQRAKKRERPPYPTEEKIDDYISEFLMLPENFSKKTAGLAAAGIGASALSSKEAKADEPTSSAEDESTPTSPALGGPELRGEKSGLSEEEYEKRKAAIRDRLEKVGVFGRHMLESGTAGLSELSVSGLAGLANMIATAGKDNPLTWDERFMQGMREDKEAYKQMKERQKVAQTLGSIAGFALPTKAGGIANAGFSAIHKAAEALPILSKARQAKGLIGAGAKIATQAGAGAAGMGLLSAAEKGIGKASSEITGLPEEKQEDSVMANAGVGAVLGGGIQTLGELGRAIGGKKGQALATGLQSAAMLGLLGGSVYDAAKSPEEEEKSQAPLTDEEREFFRRNAHLFLDDSTRHPAYQRRRVKNSTDITDSE